MHLAVVSPFPPAITGIGQYGYHVTRALAMSRAFEQITVLAGSHQNGVTPNHLGDAKIDYCWEPGKWNPPVTDETIKTRSDLVQSWRIHFR